MSTTEDSEAATGEERLRSPLKFHKQVAVALIFVLEFGPFFVATSLCGYLFCFRLYEHIQVLFATILAYRRDDSIFSIANMAIIIIVLLILSTIMTILGVICFMKYSCKKYHLWANKTLKRMILFKVVPVAFVKAIMGIIYPVVAAVVVDKVSPEHVPNFRIVLLVMIIVFMAFSILLEMDCGLVDAIFVFLLAKSVEKSDVTAWLAEWLHIREHTYIWLRVSFVVATVPIVRLALLEFIKILERFSETEEKTMTAFLNNYFDITNEDIIGSNEDMNPPTEDPLTFLKQVAGAVIWLLRHAPMMVVSKSKCERGVVAGIFGFLMYKKILGFFQFLNPHPIVDDNSKELIISMTNQAILATCIFAPVVFCVMAKLVGFFKYCGELYTNWVKGSLKRTVFCKLLPIALFKGITGIVYPVVAAISVNVVIPEGFPYFKVGLVSVMIILIAFSLVLETDFGVINAFLVYVLAQLSKKSRDMLWLAKLLNLSNVNNPWLQLLFFVATVPVIRLALLELIKLLEEFTRTRKLTITDFLNCYYKINTRKKGLVSLSILEEWII